MNYQTCVRGCVRARRHLSDCVDGDDCRGCEPRRADYGHLCWPCHRRLALMLEQAEIAERWLTGNLPSGMAAKQIKDDAQSKSVKNPAPPAPLSLAVLDTRQQLRDQLSTWVDDLVEQHNLSGPDRHSVTADSRYLLTWLDKCEQFDWIGDWWEELSDTMRDAHSVAPWRPQARRIGSIPCPECHQCKLVIFGGEEDVTCLECRTIIPPARYEIWSRIAAEEWGASA